MEISQELKDKVLAQVELHRGRLLALIPTIESDRECVMFPIYIDGVVDFIRFNVAENRFDQVEIQVAKDGIMQAEWLSDWAAYCDTTETVIIKLHLEVDT